MTRLAAFLLSLTLLTSQAQARCQGSDLRDQVSPAQLEQIRAEAARIPFATGNHWVATKGGRTVHVVGTLHVTDGRMTGIMKKLRPIIVAADEVYLEVDLKELEDAPGLFKGDPRNFALPKGRSLKSLVSQETWKRAYDIMAISGFPVEEMHHLQPWVVSEITVGSNCRGRASLSRKGLDFRIAAAARRARVPVRGLEAPGTGYKATARIPLRDQARLLEMELKSPHTLDHRVVTIFETYFDQEVAIEPLLSQKLLYRDIGISRAETGRLLRQFDAQMLDWRNRLWMPKILNSEAETLFVAVGAAHLPGKAGVLNLLHSQGFKLSRAAF